MSSEIKLLIQKIPEISVIVPCYKQAEFLDECIESVIEQTFPNWECIIVDDGSPDNTEEVAKKWCNADNRINYAKKQNGGACSARNYGINLAKGTYILPLDADNKLGPQYMESALQEFISNERLKVVYGIAEFFGNRSGVRRLPKYTFKKLLCRNLIDTCAFFYKRDWERIRGFDVNMVWGLQDWEFWINMLKDGGEVSRIESMQFYYRIHGSRISTELVRRPDRVREMRDYVVKKHIDVYIRELGNPIIFYNSKEYFVGKIVLWFPRKIWCLMKKYIKK
jgi:glycosyltransferase involved in cell wall biosynthesis